MGCLIFFFFFYVIISMVNWLIQESNMDEKGYDRVPCLFAFLRKLISKKDHTAFKESSEANGKHDLLSCQ